MLTQHEEEFVELVLEVGRTALDQDTFEFMHEEGVPVDEFVGLCSGDVNAVVQSLEEKGLASTDSRREVIRTTNLQDGDIEPVNWEDTEFKTVERRYVYFTEKLEALYRE